MAAVLERQRLVALYEFNPSVMLAEGQWPFSRQKPLAVNVGEDDGATGREPKDENTGVLREILPQTHHMKVEFTPDCRGLHS